MSADLAAANTRLLSLRQQAGSAPSTPETTPPPAAVSFALQNGQKQLAAYRQRDGVDAAPCLVPATDSRWLAERPPQPTAAEPQPHLATPNQDATVLVQPGIALAFLERGLTAVGRLYFLLRHLDHDNRGWVAVATAKADLTAADAPYPLCSWRRLRQLLAEGEGLVWERDAERIWLRSGAKIAAELQCGRLSGQPVQIPLRHLLGGIQAVRAHFYATFHSGRQAAPISRHTLEQTTHVPARTQRLYDHVAQVKRQVNLAIGQWYSQEAHQDRAWQQGRGVFPFYDSQGQQGEKNGRYVAWQLPNSYQGPHATRSSRSRKRLNQQLADLRTNGAVGNDKPEIVPCFWPDGATAAKQYNRQLAPEAYWPRAATRQRQQLWVVIA